MIKGKKKEKMMESNMIEKKERRKEGRMKSKLIMYQSQKSDNDRIENEYNQARKRLCLFVRTKRD